MQINFGSTFLDGTIRKQNDKMREELLAILNEKGLTRSDDAAQPIMEEFQKTHPKLYSDVQMVANHIDHVVKLIGVDHVGFGSDYDGVGDSLPTGLKDVSTYPNLILELLKRGYSEEDIAKMCYGNVKRVWETVEKVAESMNN